MSCHCFQQALELLGSRAVGAGVNSVLLPLERHLGKRLCVEVGGVSRRCR